MKIETGRQLERAVAELGRALGLEVKTQVKLGRRVWGRERHIDVVLRHPGRHLRLGIECKYQGVAGTAEEKITATIEDIEAWPYRGLVVMHGDGFSRDFPSYARGKGKAITFDELADWLVGYFDLPEEYIEQAEMVLNGGVQDD